jgi:hypothetical protein
MFGFRSDGKKIKKIDPLMKLVPHIMNDRCDSMVMAPAVVDCMGLDNYIFTKRRATDERFTYMDIIIAGLVRTIAERPKLNRFIMNGRVYARNAITVAITVKKMLTDQGEETTVKLNFNGTETIGEIKTQIDKEIAANTKVTTFNDADKLASLLTHIPNFMIKIAVGFLKFLDLHGLLPKSIIDFSPFHTSVFITNMKSIKMGYVYHHIYNFGTTSIFLSLGKEKYESIVIDPELKLLDVKKLLTMGGVIDERTCDGLYFGNSIRTFMRYMEHPELLETPLEKRVEDTL